MMIKVEQKKEKEEQKNTEHEKKEHKEKHDKKDEMIKELTETLQRVQAEFENYKKRCDAQQKEFAKYANASLISRLLPILDNFEIALKNIESPQEFVKGMKLIHSSLIELLNQEGVTEVNPLGEKFDPYKHEALMQEESDKVPGTVIEVLQKGYMIKDRVLRHAKVKIAKKKEHKKKKQEKEDKGSGN